MDPVTARIRSYGRFLSPAQKRALRLAGIEGALHPHGTAPHMHRWAPPSRVMYLKPNEVVSKPYEQGITVFALQARGFLMPDPKAPRGVDPRPRILTDKGRAYLKAEQGDGVP